jgi:hypothetical protein
LNIDTVIHQSDTVDSPRVATARQVTALARRILRPAARAFWRYQYRDLIEASFEPQARRLAYVEVADRRNYHIAQDETGQFAELRLYPGQPRIHRGLRSELSLHYHFEEGATVEYSLMMRLPSNFNGHKAQGGWWIVAQWHDQPDPTHGEDWSNFPGREAPIQLLYRNTADCHQIHLMYGAPVPHLVGSVDIAENQWIPIKAVIHWSRSHGHIELYFNDESEPQIAASGSNMLNSYFHFLKVGTYRDPIIQTQSSIHVRGITAKTRG